MLEHGLVREPQVKNMEFHKAAYGIGEKSI
jgi:hypothetical protein